MPHEIVNEMFLLQTDAKGHSRDKKQSHPQRRHAPKTRHATIFNT